MHPYAHLFQPLRLGRTVLKNRIEAAPVSVANLTPQAHFTPDNIAIFERKAKGGAAIVNMGEARIDLKTGISHLLCLALDDPEVMPSLILATDAIRRHNAIPAIEILHPGGRANPEYYDGPIWAPSDAPGHLGKDYTALDEKTIDYIVNCFANAAEMAWLGGVEMVMIHGGHGWLLHEFLSPLNNHRTDKFGGSLENRARISLMVVDAIRRRCPELLIEFRLSGSELVEGGLTIDDQVEFAKLLDGKVDLIHVTAGTFHYPETNQHMVPSMFHPFGVNVEFAAAIKKAVKTPVAVVGGLDEPELMEQVLAEGKADIIAVGRSIIADAQMPDKLRGGRADDVTPCIRCNHCISESFVPYVKYSSRLTRCSVNPVAGREYTEKDVCPALIPKKVLVIGGGPAGMEAAITLADRGHRVILAEKSGRLGGAIRFAGHVSFKSKLDQLMQVLIRRVERRKITVMLNTDMTPELARSLRPDAIVCAIGADPIVPPVPGVDLEIAVSAVGMHEHMEEIGQNVVILGGGLVGCEESILLGELGKKVTVLEMKPELCRDAPFLHHEAVLLEMERLGITARTGMRCTGILPDGVTADQDGKEIKLPADTVIIAAGLAPKLDEAESFRSCAPEFWKIGDCRQARNVRLAIHEGYDAGSYIE
ncbi:FAD-binding protein [[Clostridium] symbiosum]|jgi:2,4-dienoyl-CoA reductase-like NADH-dependent reductase (Old Yellow Enzyme family)/thioredoxin reductase|uniref:oxidoreductase n=1 Tax=Clostridium symbiosum TaxID=1512 RepID=UPI000E54686B|nr:FAD-dependent oxidoreductase [[Clostridium] symbiosum]RHB65548.1 FAD-binding protein [[Clostridium] symbiosum]